MSMGLVPPQLRAFAYLLVLLAVCAGCGGPSKLLPDKIQRDEHASGDNQGGAYGELLAKPLRVSVLSATQKGLLGGKGERHPVENAAVTFRIDNAECGAVFEQTGEQTAEVLTDVGGNASVGLRLGNMPGDVYIEASIETPKGKKTAEFRALAGVELIGKNLEGPTGGVIEEVGVRLTDPDGTPAAGIPVFFRVEGDGHKSQVGGQAVTRVVTNDQGTAVTDWTLGDSVQQYFILAEIEDRRANIEPGQRFAARGIEFHAMAIDRRAMLVQLLGGLAVFILGMRWMSGGLRRMADRRLKVILQAMTRNRFMATGVGALLTAVIQSSSATTVMTVGFVNAGLMTLTQAIGVVYGANIGTTITAQIIAFKLDALAYPAIAAGLVMTMTLKRPWLKALGEAILGFGLLFLGMTTMSSILKPLRHSPDFQALFQLFDCTPVEGGFVKAGPALMCIVMGTLATVVIQSSSATVGLVLALSGQGLLTFYTAVPLVLGDNIGTTITALLASLGANRNAKRAAVAHAMFNVIGAAYMYVLLFVPLWEGEPVFLGLVDAFTPGRVFAAQPENLVRHVANAHTAFNVFNVVLFLPFVGLMAAISKRIIPVTMADQERVLEYLEPHLLDSPSLALRQAVKEVAYMVRRARKSIGESCAFLYNGKAELEQNILAREELIDRLQHEITAYLVDLSRRPLTPEEATLLPALVHAVNDAERIGDHSEEMLELVHVKRDNKLSLTGTAVEDIKRLEEILMEQFDAVVRSLEEESADEVEAVVRREQEVDDFMAAAAENHVKRLENGECDVQAGVIFLDFLSHLERVGDHLSNIAERACRIVEVTGEVRRAKEKREAAQ